jgi:hypothetical protein
MQKALSLACAFVAIAACSDDDNGSTPAGGTDGGKRPEGGTTDAGVDAGPTFCTTQTADFCADFDRGTTPGNGWSGVATAGGGTLVLEPSSETSAPNVLKATLPAVDGASPNAASAQVAKQDMPLDGKKKLTLALRAKIGDAKPSAASHLVSYFTLKVDRGTFSLFRTDSRWFVSVARTNAGGLDVAEPALTTTLALDKWIKIELEIVVGRPSGSVKLRIDGQEAVSETIATIGDAPPGKDDVSVAIGPTHASGVSAAFDARFDDVTLTLAP